MATTLYWHDYETFGTDPRRDRPAQFAGVRTDEAFNEIGKPLVIYCKPPRDALPQPVACLITGITPQLADEKGLPEPEFVARIHAELEQPDTCGVGYNTLRFDDEVTRYALYRNFFDPYAREWQNGNSRWDLIDLVRMTYALRPEGIEWPLRESEQSGENEGSGQPSFRLEDLTAANGISHGAAHDALSDVRATIGLARLLYDRQPRLYNWLFQLRNKRRAAELLDFIQYTPVVHTSRMYPAKTGCTTLVMPLAAESDNPNSVLVYDLRHDPERFLDMNQSELGRAMFTRAEDLSDGEQRLPVKSVKINKCPALAPRNTLTVRAAEHIEIDLAACQRHWQKLSVRCTQTDFAQRVVRAYTGREYAPAVDVDHALYDGFIDNADRLLFTQIRRATPQALAKARFDFHDKRLPELFFRYRARNWPQALLPDEALRWDQLRRERLTHGTGGDSLNAERYFDQIAILRSEQVDNAKALGILDALACWGNDLMNF
ncbi:exodeoxyribonuclease I [Nitrosomonas aestuarii]|uniref:exodeoxyribonuclease I n=1 Tax=Nitrosomonas aestuarii TaxID=52441 RepID=UPI000D301C9A|nr:exodeoxyribonuclease I [Nitrosomonas aestuarii]PTN12134.1 exodeoxyribonuclease I subunit C [Nitrosomonas aestuarii]